MANQPEEQTTQRTVSLKPILWAFAIGCMIFIFPGIVLLVAGGMLPTLTAYWIDRTPQKYSAFCVGSLNFSGVFPSVIELWTGRNTVEHAWAIISTDPFTLAIMYGAAAVGWALYLFIPSLIVAFLTVVAQHRIAELRARQRELVRVWGTEIAVESSEEDMEEEE
jgi:hypothetical protein